MYIKTKCLSCGRLVCARRFAFVRGHFHFFIFISERRHHFALAMNLRQENNRFLCCLLAYVVRVYLRFLVVL